MASSALFIYRPFPESVYQPTWVLKVSFWLLLVCLLWGCFWPSTVPTLIGIVIYVCFRLNEHKFQLKRDALLATYKSNEIPWWENVVNSAYEARGQKRIYFDSTFAEERTIHIPVGSYDMTDTSIEGSSPCIGFSDPAEALADYRTYKKGSTQ
jgi:hypothetical protein